MVIWKSLDESSHLNRKSNEFLGQPLEQLSLLISMITLEVFNYIQSLVREYDSIPFQSSICLCVIVVTRDASCVLHIQSMVYHLISVSIQCLLLTVHLPTLPSISSLTLVNSPLASSLFPQQGVPMLFIFSKHYHPMLSFPLLYHFSFHISFY